MLRPESLATEASRVSRADADGAGGTDASPAPFAFRRVAITPPDGFADSRRARADLVALRKSVTLQRAARRYLPPFPSARSDRPILAPCRPDQFRRRSRACAGRFGRTVPDDERMACPPDVGGHRGTHLAESDEGDLQLFR